MKRPQAISPTTPHATRRGSTLIIVLALLGLLAFTGMFFLTFSSQERAAAEYFSEAAKAEVNEPDDPFPWALEQLLIGANNRQKASIVWSPTSRHSILRNQIGSDITPHSGDGVHVIYDTGSGLPGVDSNFDGVADAPSSVLDDRLNFVDALAAYGFQFGAAPRGFTEGEVTDARDYQGTNAFPQPDVDYTYPDINNLFLAYKGFAIRDNGTAAVPRFEQVPVIIPSFFRPQYLKSSTANGDPTAGNPNVPTDFNWWDDVAHPVYRFRSFRPHPQHIGGYRADGTPVFRYLDVTRPADAALIAALPLASGEFPFRPAEGVRGGVTAGSTNSADFGKLGVWTGHRPVNDPAGNGQREFELDSDNDGDGIREGIWMDFSYPVQETANGEFYATLHSFTILDLDGLIDLNIHGNLAGLPRDAVLTSLVGAAGMGGNPVSVSNLGLGPNEVSPFWALMPDVPDSGTQFTDWFTANPINREEQANMELVWLLTGRMNYDTGASGLWSDPTDVTEVLEGRWGDANALLFHKIGGGSRVNALPRPGRAGDIATASTSPIDFGGVRGFDDNADAFEGVRSAETGRVKGFVHPMDYSGNGNTTPGIDVRLPRRSNGGVTTSPAAWLQYARYSLLGSLAAPLNDSRYLAGPDQIYGNADDLVAFPQFDMLLDDPLEMIVDLDTTLRPDDQMFGYEDLVYGHIPDSPQNDKANISGLSTRLNSLMPFAFAEDSDRSDRFTTLSSTLRYGPITQQLGANMVRDSFGSRGGDDGPRWWEWTADADGADTDNDGFGNGDGFFEFPPRFGVAQPYSVADPFRPQVRRLLTAEAGEQRTLIGQLPLSVNHILDVNRNNQTPREGTPRFLAYLQRTGMRLRPLTEHPDAEFEGPTVLATNVIPNYDVNGGAVTLPNFPPQTFGEREFWARRDRQQLARDIYVLLYTIGGAEIAGSGNEIRDYTGINDPNAAPGVALYTHDQLRRMAQFAVNLVDAMDSDNVITRFEYDKNLGDGWNLDDNPITDDGFVPAVQADPEYAAATQNGLYPQDSVVDRGVVFGVEAQQLAFSEVLGIRSPEIAAADHQATPYDDQLGIRDFLFVELQNMLPMPLDLAQSNSNSATTALWRLARFDRLALGDPVEHPTAPDAAIAMLNDPQNVIDGGGRFTISAASDSGLNGTQTSAFFVDLGDPVGGSFDGNFELIAPDVPGVLDTSSPGFDQALTDIDVLHANHVGRFASTGGSFMGAVIAPVPAYAGNQAFNDAAGQAVSGFDAAPPIDHTTAGFDLVLQRRLNPNMPALDDLVENPWVEVDRIRVMLADFNLFDGASPLDVFDPADDHKGVGRLKSTERLEPLSDALGISRLLMTQPKTAAVPNPVPHRFNTLKGDSVAISDMLGVNSGNLVDTTVRGSDATPFTLWQPHFDRDYSSTGELLNLPVVGPNLLTQRLDRMRLGPFQQTGNAVSDPDLLSNAAAMFLMPDFTDLMPPRPVESALDNRWYRLLQFVEVPSRVNRMLGNYLALTRIPGKLNPNTIRHREVYAGLIDDPNFTMAPVLTDAAPQNNAEDGPFLPGLAPLDGTDGTPGLGVRDRWQEFVNERDGLVTGWDPTAPTPQVANFWMPGTPNSRPFRSFNHVGTFIGADNGGDSTLLRRLGVDLPAGTHVNRAGEGSMYTSAVDPATNRHWLEVGDRQFHAGVGAGAETATTMQKHQLLSKILNNTTTVSNCFIIYATAAYFEAVPDPNSTVFRVGGRMGLDLDGDSDHQNDAGWERRAVFIVDRTELFNAYDPGSGSFDWERLVKHRVDLPSDGQ